MGDWILRVHWPRHQNHAKPEQGQAQNVKLGETVQFNRSTNHYDLVHSLCVDHPDVVFLEQGRILQHEPLHSSRVFLEC